MNKMVSRRGLYQKGARFERLIVNLARKNGFISARTAGSHSNVDIFIIDPSSKRMWVYQAKKHKKASQNALKRKFGAFESLSDEYIVKFGLITDIKQVYEDLMLTKLKGGT